MPSVPHGEGTNMVQLAPKRRLACIERALRPHDRSSTPAAATSPSTAAATVDFAHLEQHGFVIIPNAIGEPLLDNLLREIWHFLDASSDDPDSWYRRPVGSSLPSVLAGTHLAMFGTQGIWDIQQSPELYEIFATLHGERELWCSWNGAVFCKPPVRKDLPVPAHLLPAQYQPDDEIEHEPSLGLGWGGPQQLHWDLQAAERRAGGMPRPGLAGGPGRWQSVLCLEDTPADRGGWWCVPGYHKLWANADFHFRLHSQAHVTERGTDGDALTERMAKNVLTNDDILGMECVREAGLSLYQPATKKGDLIVWNNLLPHGSGVNTSTRPRLAMLVGCNPISQKASYRTWKNRFSEPCLLEPPTTEDTEAERQFRITRWRERNGQDPENDPIAEGSYGRERLGVKPARLTLLGRKLLGLDPW